MKTNKLHCALASLPLLAGFLLLTSCNYEVRPTSVKVEDSIRHYYPIPAGHVMTVDYDLRNIGKNPLVISDIQTSCGCISTAERRYIIPPDTKTTLRFKYHSDKNIGLADNSIYLYGNFSTGSLLVLHFDVHVVPPSDYIRDYEELHERHRQIRSGSGEHATAAEPSAAYYVDVPE